MRYTNITKDRERKEGFHFSHFLGQPVLFCPFSEIAPLDRPKILLAGSRHLGLHFGRLDLRFELWFVGYSFWTEAAVSGDFFPLCFSIVDYYGCLFLGSLRTLWRTLDWFV